MKDHTRETCDPPCDEMKGCCACNLFCCGVCGGAEGSLPTECPGTKMSQALDHLVYKSTLDFREGQWMRRPYEEWETPDAGDEVIVDMVVKKLNEERKRNVCAG